MEGNKRLKHIISAEQFDREILENLFDITDRTEIRISRIGGDHFLLGRVLAYIFYEPSTRTRLSFESAMLRLGGNVIGTDNAAHLSSAAKGEALEDAIRVVGGYSDIIVLRHSSIDSAERAAAVSAVPVINAGNGSGEHPTQALLDLYTIRRKLNKIDGINIAIVGDLKYGRTVHSLSRSLVNFEGVSMTFISPEQLQLDADTKTYLDKNNVDYRQVQDLKEACGADVVYQTRIQKERFSDPELYREVKGKYVIDDKFASSMRSGAIIMHPGPRVEEITRDVDRTDKAVYFEQSHYGLPVRMALIKLLLS
ncbi:MAG: aspartate carbamoyltransferase [Candidatus Spechtbacterales bacterium]|nr:aspartate carbamoyltransferase [Candidatus Spechtbacterales bacterium]